MKVHRITRLVATTILALESSSILPVAASDAGGSAARVAHTSKRVRQRLFMSPHCFVAGLHTSARVTLTHAGPHARVEFIWAPKKGVTLGPGFGPGIFRSNAAGIVHFAAVVPSRYGPGTVGTWVFAAEWPQAAHAFVRTTFKIVPDTSTVWRKWHVSIIAE